MATKYVCDRCHAESEHRNQIFAVAIPMLIGGEQRGDRDYAHEIKEQQRDLCKPCLRLLEGIIKPIVGPGR